MADRKSPIRRRNKSRQAAKHLPAKKVTVRPVATRRGAPPETVARIRSLNREQAAFERAVRTAREKTLTAYRARFAQLQARRVGPVKRIFAEGDSWFNYPLGRAAVSQLEELIDTPIANFAWPGAESRQLLALHERKEIAKRLESGPERGKKFDILLFSGGGDDIVGDQMCLFLDRYDPQHPGKSVLNERFTEVLDLVMGAYQDLVSLRDALSPDTLIVGHVYDFAWATGKGACWLGPWIRPSLDYAGVPRGDPQHAVVIEMLRRFEIKLNALATAAGKFIVVPTHDTLKEPSDWANELHPKDPGFHKIAVRFQAALQPHLL